MKTTVKMSQCPIRSIEVFKFPSDRFASIVAV